MKGDNFSIRLLNKEQQEKATKPYERMGEVFAIEHNFYGREARDFTGAEYYSLPERIMVGMAFRTIVRRIFNRAAKSWGCKDKLDAKPYKVSGKLNSLDNYHKRRGYENRNQYIDAGLIS